MELRVHGMGDHHPLSALGSAEVVPTESLAEGESAERVSAEKPVGVEVYRSPAAPDHEVRFLNWTRSSRYRVPFVWYLALPYTLINVAGWMAPRGWARIPHSVMTMLWSSFASLGTMLWATLTAETILRHIFDFPADQRRFGVLAVVAITSAMLSIMWWRTVLKPRWRAEGNYGLHRRRVVHTDEAPEGKLVRDRTLLAMVAIQSILLISMAVAVCVAQPNTRDLPCVVHAEGSAGCVLYGSDWVTLFALITLSLSGIMVVLFTLLNRFADNKTWSRTDADPLLGGALLATVGLMVLNLGWSAALRAVTWLCTYISKLDTDLASSSYETAASGLLRPPSDFVYGPEIVVGIATPYLFIAVGMWFLFRFSRFDAKNQLHALICDESRLRLTLAALGLVAFCATIPAIIVLVGYPRWERDAGRNAAGEPIGTVNVLATISDVSVDILLGLVLAILVFPALRRPFAVIGDIAGYWDVKWHPMAALPYRRDVVDFLKSQIERATPPFVLVGHSQGSVLAFTAIYRTTAPALNIHLITCGSPLLSLYSRFFPSSFGKAERRLVESRVITWINFWRDSDPIGCPLFGSIRDGYEQRAPHTFDFPDPATAATEAGQTPVASVVAESTGTTAIVDARPAAIVGHSDYWLVPAQRNYIRAIHGITCPTGRLCADCDGEDGTWHNFLADLADNASTAPPANGG